MTVVLISKRDQQISELVTLAGLKYSGEKDKGKDTKHVLMYTCSKTVFMYLG